MPLDIWYFIMLSALCGYAGSASGWLELLSFPLYVLFSLMIMRWVIAKLAWQGQTAPLQFVGDYWRLLGWTVVLALSTITIIGWAWVAAAMTRWICRHIEGSSKELSFIAGGWSVLWRSLLFGFSCVFIIPNSMDPALVFALDNVAILPGRPDLSGEASVARMEPSVIRGRHALPHSAELTLGRAKRDPGAPCGLQDISNRKSQAFISLFVCQ